MPELIIRGRKVTVGADVAAAYDLIHREHAAHIVHDNGQAKGPFVAFGFANSPVQIGMRLNLRKLTVYARERTPLGELLSDAVPGLVVEERYDQARGNPVHSIKNGLVPYLQPTKSPVVLAVATVDNIRSLLRACLGKGPPSASLVPASETVSVMAEDPSGTPPFHRPLTPEDLLVQLDRRSELGKMGEGVAVRYEQARLRNLGCATPAHYVEHVALEDVGLGYDILSTWPGHERWIEVKTSSSAGLDFYVSCNEREVLRNFGDKAWIYRVAPGASGFEVIDTISDPEARIPADRFSAQVWRVRWP